MSLSVVFSSRWARVACLSLSLCSLGTALRAGETTPAAVQSVVSASDPFAKGAMEVEVLAGGYTTSAIPRTPDPKIAHVGAELRLGIMLSGRNGRSFWRGNHEFLIGAFGDGVVQGPGNHLGGARLYIRRNFLFGSERIVPYFQFGGGVFSNDIYLDRQQTQIGGAFGFAANTEAGVRFRIRNGFSFLVEGGYEHLSNAHIYQRNDSFNGLGGRVGFSRSF